MTPGRGWYCYLSPNASDKIAKDLKGPFPSRKDVFDWARENRVEYRPNAEVFKRATFAWSEMTDQKAGGIWCTAVHFRRG